MGNHIYSSAKRDSTVNKYSNRAFTKMDCLKWLDTLEDESVNLWICYDEQTEVMTDSGWKFFKDVNIKTDKFLSMNPENKDIEYIQAIHKIEKHYSGPMYDFHTDKVHITVTPEHKLITEYQWEKDVLHFEKAEDIYHKGNRYFQKNGGNWYGVDTGITPEFAYLLGVYITDGSCQFRKSRSPRVFLSQKKQNIREKIKTHLKYCKINYTEHKEGFYISACDSRKFEPLCNKSERRVPEVIKYATQDVITSFLEGAIDGDGDNTKETKNGMFGSRRISMSNLKLLEDIQGLLYKVNCSGRIIERNCVGKKVSLKSENRIIETKKITYVLSISNKSNNKVSKTSQQFKNETWVNYDGYVYCVSLPKWHTVLVKKGFTCPTWQAQCDPPYNVLTGNMKNKNGAALFHSRYTAKVSPSESDFEKELVSSRFEIAIPWEEQRKLEDYKEWCYKWYCKAHQKLADDSFMFIFWSMRYLSLAYQIFDVNRVIFWQQPNMVSTISGDFSYDITPIIVIRKGNPRLIKEAGLWDKSSVLNFTKPQGNYIKDKLCHNCQKPRALLEHLVWLSGADQDGNVIGDFFAGSGSLLRAVNRADVILCDKNREYYDKFFDVYVSDPRVYRCEIKDPEYVRK